MKIRLESDDNRVKIVTMHSSKGLQYPIVYAPFLWDSAWGKNGNNVCYDEVSDENGRSTYTRKIDVGDYSNPDTSNLSKLESWDDRIRLMYVAFTRAQFRCYVPYVSHIENLSSPIFGALIKSFVDDPESFVRANYLEIIKNKAIPLGEDVSADSVLSFLMTKLAENHKDVIYFETVVNVIPADPIKLKTELKSVQVEQFSESNELKLKPERSITSYSSINRKYDKHETGAERIRDEESDADYDATGDGKGEIFRFPKGAQTGNLWHEIFELIDFTVDSRHDAVIEQCCIKHGFDPVVAKDVIKQLIKDTLGARLSGAQDTGGWRRRRSQREGRSCAPRGPHPTRRRCRSVSATPAAREHGGQPRWRGAN